MITEECIERVLPVVADSWDRLRGCDVHRLVDATLYLGPESLQKAGEIIAAKRPDLAKQIADAVADTMEDQFG